MLLLQNVHDLLDLQDVTEFITVTVSAGALVDPKAIFFVIDMAHTTNFAVLIPVLAACSLINTSTTVDLEDNLLEGLLNLQHLLAKLPLEPAGHHPHHLNALQHCSLLINSRFTILNIPFL